NKSIICHANLQIVLETFSHTQQASKYSQSNGAETALTTGPERDLNLACVRSMCKMRCNLSTNHLLSRDA
ncbi:hypothetical protein EXN68_24805, partial [Rhizobium rhizogenes]